MPKRLPKLCHHKPSGQAYVRVRGRMKYLGKHGSETAQEKYDALIASLKREDEMLAFGISVGQLALLYMEHAVGYYVKDGTPTSEVNNLRLALRPLIKRFRNLKVRDFSPRKLKQVRDDMISAGIVRTSINRQVDRIRRVFKWGVGEELVPPTAYMALQSIPALKKGRCKAAESKPVMPVPEANIEAVKPFVSRQVWAAIQLQLLTGARPTEILTIRECDIDATGEVWTYRPHRHKTEHHGKARTICIGPRAQEVIKEFLVGSPMRYLLSPADARADFDANRRASRKTPLTPSQRARTRVVNPKKKPRDRYDVTSYRRAIVNACRATDVPEWSPGQLRHNAASNIRARFGDVDAARTVLGHSATAVTEVYAERDMQRAAEIARLIG